MPRNLPPPLPLPIRFIVIVLTIAVIVITLPPPSRTPPTPTSAQTTPRHRPRRWLNDSHSLRRSRVLPLPLPPLSPSRSTIILQPPPPTNRTLLLPILPLPASIPLPIRPTLLSSTGFFAPLEFASPLFRRRFVLFGIFLVLENLPGGFGELEKGDYYGGFGGGFEGGVFFAFVVFVAGGGFGCVCGAA